MPSTDRQSVARAAGDALTAHAERLRALRIVAGFDAVVDSILDVVHARDGERYSRTTSIAGFGHRIADAAGRCANFELVLKQRKVGGNACNLADAASTLGARLTLLAGLSDERDPDAFDPVLRPLAERCERVISLGTPSHTDALEFDDGKVMFGKIEPLDRVTWDVILQAVGGPGALAATLAGADALVTGNWTMTRSMNDIWLRLAQDVLPALDERDRPARLFVDTSDPAKRSDEDLTLAVDRLRAIDALVPVALGLNLAEATRVSTVAGSTPPPAHAMTDASALRDAAGTLRESLGISAVVLHSRFCAASAEPDEAAAFEGPYTSSPALSTGAGDNFNAGWLLADRLGLPAPQCLAVGSAVAGWYVRKGASPTLSDVCAFLTDLPAPEPA